MAVEVNIIREKLEQYLRQGDDKLLKLMYAVAQTYENEQEGLVISEFNSEDIQRYEDRHLK